ncbi:MAG: PAS domain S-box protein, partial [Candidatus Thermoplasmatota archaeon]|nr:PAS domain S-box protein [Candidatus Thermoplasmatota archaeon]
MSDGSDKIEKDRTENVTDASLYMDSSNPVFIIDKKGRFLDINNAFCEKFGIFKNKILGMPVNEAGFLTENGRKREMHRRVSRLIGKATPIYTLDVIDKDGDEVSLEVESKPHFVNGRNIGDIGIVKNSRKIDLQPTKRIEEKRKKSQKKKFDFKNTEFLDALDKIRK